MESYPHMCRMDHVEIGHRDSDNERCPLCRCMDERDEAIRERDEARALAVFATRHAAEYSFERLVYWRTNADMVVEDCDGTDAGILDALRKAKEASDAN